MVLSLAVRTVDRTPKRNYVGGTLDDLAAQGVDLARVHLCVTAPDTTWLDAQLAGLDVRPRLSIPPTRRTANENGLAQVAAALTDAPNYVVLLEDDLRFIADFAGSVARWMAQHERPDRHVYRLFGWTRPPFQPYPQRRLAPVTAYDWPLGKLRGSQAVVLRADDARDFLSWGTEHLETWRREAPWGASTADPSIAFDKLLACWALTRWPGQPCLMSHPYFVKHVGIESSIHGRGQRNDALFGGPAYRYAPTDFSSVTKIERPADSRSAT
jgi:hypothetical protein